MYFIISTFITSILSLQPYNHTISKFLPEVSRAIQDEFTREYLKCPTTPDEWKELEREFRIRWNVPHALGALDGKHVALKKPKNSGALYHNYKGFFSIVMLALVDGQYKFRWVDVGTAGSCSDAQIFNASQLKRRIEAPITQGGRDVPYFILADDAFALKTWLMKPYGRRLLTREERIANYRISRGRRVVENACGLIGGVAGGGQDRNPAREAKRQTDYLKDYFNNEGAVAWQDGRI